MSVERVSLIIPGKNAAKTIRLCLDSVIPMLADKPTLSDDPKQDNPSSPLTEIIFVDDGSTDNTADIVGEYADHAVKCIPSGGKGPGGARNVGWRAATGDLCWFIDSDCVADSQALNTLLPHLTDPEVAGAGGSYTNMFPDSLLACLIHEEIVQRHRQMPGEVNFLGGFDVIYRKSVLENVGGFDEHEVNGPGSPGAEDIELSYRIHQAGHKMRFEPKSLVGHHHPTNLRRYLRSQRHHGYWRAHLHLKHRSEGAGDAYSSLVDNLQPPVAMLILAAIPTLLYPPARWVLPALILLLALMQLPMTVRLIARTASLKYALFAPMGVLRAFARGFGLSWGVLTAITGGGR